jgi:hypothetical protein
LGISGFKGSVEQIAALLLKPQFKHVAVLHLQEARLSKRDIPKWRKIAGRVLPKFAMYVHCQIPGVKSTTAVVTLVRKELTKWISPMAVGSPEWTYHCTALLLS